MVQNVRMRHVFTVLGMVRLLGIDAVRLLPLADPLPGEEHPHRSDAQFEPHAPPERQAAAVLHRLFDERETTVARARLGQLVGGVPMRAFGEILWMARSRGTTESEGITVFLALVREKNGWRINQIRVMR